MERKRFYYLIRLQFLGFRYSGWQKQPGQRTIEGMLQKTLKFVLPDKKFKILASGRTDAKVSALNAVFELFLDDEPLTDPIEFLKTFNTNLPPDIRALEIKTTTKDFNVIQDSKIKEYIYLFSFGEKNHPFSAPFLTHSIADLDLDSMLTAAKFYEGEHDFSSYTARIKPNTKILRGIEKCEIVENTLLTANFFPEKSYALIVRGEGFMRYQIRMIMGALFQLGKGELSMDDIKKSLQPNTDIVLTSVAPASGLILNRVHFK
ncbi:tRNA pseudouridine synthase A [Maribacter sp. 2304DJ31-5]|uniref:tRNA pseudouridine synthase A n=1 Tax=Maribacter sp. 2304DJ31-5 TaxID=3386273 RepID=UPI0039BCD3B1